MSSLTNSWSFCNSSFSFSSIFSSNSYYSSKRNPPSVGVLFLGTCFLILPTQSFKQFTFGNFGAHLTAFLSPASEDVPQTKLQKTYPLQRWLCFLTLYFQVGLALQLLEFLVAKLQGLQASSDTAFCGCFCWWFITIGILNEDMFV